MKRKASVKVRSIAFSFYVILVTWVCLSISLAETWVRLLSGCLSFYQIILLVSSVYRIRALLRSINASSSGVRPDNNTINALIIVYSAKFVNYTLSSAFFLALGFDS